MVKVTGYTERFLPISVVKAIRAGTGVGLAEGKALMERIIAGEDVLLIPAADVADETLVESLRVVGVESEVVA